MNSMTPDGERPSDPVDGGRLQPPAPSQPSVPDELAALTWPSDAVTADVPTRDDPTWVPHRESAAGPATAGTDPAAPSLRSVPNSSSPNETTHPASPAADDAEWTWTPITSPGASTVVRPAAKPAPDLSIRLDVLDALVDERPEEDGGAAPLPAPSAAHTPQTTTPDPARDPAASTPPPTPAAGERSVVREPSASEAADGFLSAGRTGADPPSVTAAFPAAAGSTPAGGFVLPDAPAKVPPVPEVSEPAAPPTLRSQTRRRGRVYVVGLLIAALLAAAAYVGLREYIYGDEGSGDDRRVVELEAAGVAPAP